MAYDLATITNPSGALTDFSLMIDLSTMSASWWSANDTADGTKGRVFKDDGSTELAADWINFDSGADSGWLRVKYSGTLAASGTQKIRIYPPKAANASYGRADTYGQDNAYASHWEGYWPDGGGIDRTVNERTASAGGSGPTIGAGTGKVGASTVYDGINDYCDAGDVNDLDGVANLTWAGWVKRNDFQAALDQLFGKWSTAGSNGWVVIISSNYGSDDLLMGGDSGANFGETNNNVLPDLTWTYVVCRFDGGGSGNSGRLKAYINKVNETLAFTGTIPATTPSTAYPVRFGADEAGNRSFKGDLDDIQVHTAALSIAWTDEEYDQTNDQSTFWGTWTWTTTGLAGTVSDGLDLGDTLSAFMTRTIVVSDGMDAGDSITRVKRMSRTASDGMDAGDAIDRTKRMSRSASDGMDAGDSITRVKGMSRTVSDGADLGDALLKNFSRTETIADGLDLGDTIARTRRMLVSIADGMDTGSGQLVKATFNTIILDGLNLGDTASAILQGVLTGIIADGMNLGDTLSAQLSTFSTITEGLNLGDTLSGNLGAVLAAAIADGLDIGDITANSLTINVSIADGMDLGDQVGKAIRFLTSISDGLDIGDGLSGTIPTGIIGPVTITFTATTATITFTSTKPDVAFTGARPDITFS